ncbi:MAG: Nif3-like dinuclear metal center hexameric protein [Puniceicoccales bacterium]
MAKLSDIVKFCDERTRIHSVKDFPPAHNGLQIENNGTVTKIGAAVDAGLVPFEKAAAAGIDFLIVHHGVFWNPPVPITEHRYRKIKTAFDHNLAVYGSHLPLDCHPEIGNNAILAKKLGLEVDGGFVHYEGNDIAVTAPATGDRAQLRAKLEELFPTSLTAIEEGPAEIKRIGILTGSGRSAIPELRANGIDTFITGELKQEHFNIAQEEGFNIYLGGHYATETFGVCALAEKVAAKFKLEWEFVSTMCPL